MSRPISKVTLSDGVWTLAEMFDSDDFWATVKRARELQDQDPDKTVRYMPWGPPETKSHGST